MNEERGIGVSFVDGLQGLDVNILLCEDFLGSCAGGEHGYAAAY